MMDMRPRAGPRDAASDPQRWRSRGTPYAAAGWSKRQTAVVARVWADRPHSDPDAQGAGHPHGDRERLLAGSPRSGRGVWCRRRDRPGRRVSVDQLRAEPATSPTPTHLFDLALDTMGKLRKVPLLPCAR